MSDAAELVKVIKRTAMEAVEKGKPVNILFGKVVSADPLRINVEQRMELGRSQLILGRNVTDYEDGGDRGGQERRKDGSYSTGIEGKKEKVTVLNGFGRGIEFDSDRQQCRPENSLRGSNRMITKE